MAGMCTLILPAPLPVLFWDCTMSDMWNCLKSQTAFLGSEVVSKFVVGELTIVTQNI